MRLCEYQYLMKIDNRKLSKMLSVSEVTLRSVIKEEKRASVELAKSIDKLTNSLVSLSDVLRSDVSYDKLSFEERAESLKKARQQLEDARI